MQVRREESQDLAGLSPGFYIVLSIWYYEGNGQHGGLDDGPEVWRCSLYSLVNSHQHECDERGQAFFQRVVGIGIVEVFEDRR